MEDNKEIKKLLLDLTRKVDRLDARVSKSLDKPERKTWVKASTVKEMTGWGYAKMLAHRRNRTITWRRDDTGIWYLLESIPERLTINKTTAV
jgi:hypothetical protein